MPLSSPFSTAPALSQPVRHRSAIRAGLLSLAWALAIAPALAQPAAEACPKPEGPVVLQLRIAGKAPQGCDLKSLMALPARELTTALPDDLGLPGRSRWLGVSLRQLVERLGAGPADTVQLAALNDYTVTIPWSDLQQYDPVLAYHRNGQAMSVREKGPLILVYPFDSHPGLHTQHHINRSIWQVNAVTLK